MKALAINSSPRKDKGNTSLILTPFLEGLKEAGADVELYYASDLKINSCLGDFSCWSKPGGRCGQDDDMTWLDGKIRDADVLILASPVYCDGATGPMKTLLDRTIPQVMPIFEIRDNHTRHPLQENVKKSKIVLVSNCGLWERDNFDPLVAHIKAYCKNANAEFAGALLRPHGEALKPMLQMGMSIKDVLEAAKDAGRQLATSGRISPDTLEAISRDLMPRDMYVQMANQYLQGLLDKCN
jgi:multimeric flavodoxin WrbA